MNGRRTYRIRLIVGMAVGTLLSADPQFWAGEAPAQELAPQEEPFLAPFVMTPQEVVDNMLRLAEVGKDDLVYDLGSGDGRIVITAARRYGARGVGFEIDPDLVRRSRENALRAGVVHLVEFHEQDVMTLDLSPATVVTLYLFREANLKLRPRIQSQLRPGSRVVSHGFDMGDWVPAAIHPVTPSVHPLRILEVAPPPPSESFAGGSRRPWPAPLSCCPAPSYGSPAPGRSPSRSASAYQERVRGFAP